MTPRVDMDNHGQSAAMPTPWLRDGAWEERMHVRMHVEKMHVRMHMEKVHVRMHVESGEYGTCLRRSVCRGGPGVSG